MWSVHCGAQGKVSLYPDFSLFCESCFESWDQKAIVYMWYKVKERS